MTPENYVNTQIGIANSKYIVLTKWHFLFESYDFTYETQWQTDRTGLMPFSMILNEA